MLPPRLAVAEFQALKLAEYAVFAADLFLFAVLLWKAVSRTVKHL